MGRHAIRRSSAERPLLRLWMQTGGDHVEFLWTIETPARIGLRFSRAHEIQSRDPIGTSLTEDILALDANRTPIRELKQDIGLAIAFNTLASRNVGQLTQLMNEMLFCNPPPYRHLQSRYIVDEIENLIRRKLKLSLKQMNVVAREDR